MIIDAYKDHLNFAYFLTGEKLRPEKELKQFIRDGGGNEVDFGVLLEPDPEEVKKQFILWSTT